MQLHTIDWIIALFSIAICFVPALFFGKRSRKNTAEFFASGRSVPWWLAGISMVATTFSSDTPNLVANFVRTQGVAGNWQWWSFTLTGVATVFFFARLWRRSGVLTDLEFYELRYSGKAASAVRGFRALYLGLFFNCIIMASVNLVACKIAAILFGLPRWQTLLAVGLLNVIFAAHSGLWGVLVIDMFQFFIKMTAVIGAAYFAVTLPAVGGTLFFNVAHYVLRPWPWILVGLASLIVYPELSDIQKAFPNLDPHLLGHDIAYPAMLRFLPAGWVGLMLGGLVAANSSTILTHLNWGASYLVHDFYRRFVNTEATEKHYVRAGRCATVLLFAGSSGMVFLLTTAKDSFNLLLQVGAGTGLLYLLRWFWWRITAWCEIV